MTPPIASLTLGDSIEVLAGDYGLRPKMDSIFKADAAVTDPPYGISFAGDKEWDTFEDSRTFTNAADDGRAFTEWTKKWAKPLFDMILWPGAHILMFGASNAIHRATSGLEDVGFSIRIGLAWCYATGQVKHKNQLRPGFEPITLGRKPGEEYEKLFKTKGRGMTNAQDWKAEDGKHPSTLLLDESVVTAEPFEDPIDNALAKAASYFYVAKPSNKDRDYGCEDLEKTDRTTSIGKNNVRCRACGYYKQGCMAGVASCYECHSTDIEVTTNQGLNVHPCLPPGEMVLTENGYRPIETLRVGDRVYSGDGTFRPAIDVFSAPCDGEVVTIGVDGTNQTTRATTNHPFLLWRPMRKHGALRPGDLGWYDAADVRVGDYTLTPICEGGSDNTWTVDQAWAFGLWVAEGSLLTSGNSLYPVWTLNANETDFVDRLRRTFGGVNVYPRKESKAQNVIVFDSTLAATYERLAGRGAKKKRLAREVFELTDELRREVVNGYLDGDGCVTRKSRIAKTASTDLEATMAILLESVGYHVASFYADPKGFALINGRRVDRKPYWLMIAKNNPTLRKPRFITYGGRQYSVRRVKKVQTDRYVGPVWNLTVDQEHTFQTRVGLSHNTVKSITLMRRLVRLVTKPGGSVIDPFTGSGTTGVAAVLEGRNFCGVEREPQYFVIAASRIAKALEDMGNAENAAYLRQRAAEVQETIKDLPPLELSNLASDKRLVCGSCGKRGFMKGTRTCTKCNGAVSEDVGGGGDRSSTLSGRRCRDCGRKGFMNCKTCTKCGGEMVA